MRLLFLSLFITVSSIGQSQTIIDSNHVYNTNAHNLMMWLKGTILRPDLANGKDLSKRCIGLIDTLYADLKTDSLKYITEYDSTNMYWNMVGHQVGKRRNYIAFVLNVTDRLASDFYENALGGQFYSDGGYGPTTRWLGNGLQYCFVLDISTGKIIYYYNPMNRITVSKLER